MNLSSLYVASDKPSRIGFGAAQTLLEHGANVTIVSSSDKNVQSALQQLNGGDKVRGAVGDVRNEASFTELLNSLGQFDHVVFSGVDKIIRGSLADTDLEQAKYLFGVKFWGSITIGKSNVLFGVKFPISANLFP